jgi:phosphatidylinositol alpha-mannosyltransferase
VVATFHAAFERSRALSTLRPVLAPVLRKVGVAIVVSSGAADSMSMAMSSRSAQRQVLIPNGITVSAYGPPPGVSADPRHVLGFLGRTADARKGLPVLVEAFNRIAERRPDVDLLVVGPADEHAVRRLVDPRFAGRVEVTGVLAEADKVRALHRMTVLCAPNLRGESFGMVLAEGLAAGVPVLASDIEPFRELLDGGRAGVLFEPGGWRGLADEAEALLDDPARRGELSRRGRVAAARYDWDVLVPHVMAAYNRAIDAAPPVMPRRAPGCWTPGTRP